MKGSNESSGLGFVGEDVAHRVQEVMDEPLKCPAKLKDGRVCGRAPLDKDLWCGYHSPHGAEKRKAAASKAAKSKPLSESAALRRRLNELLDEVLATRDPGLARLAAGISTLANSIIGTLKLDAKIRELEDVERRLRDLERAAKNERRL